MPPRGFTLPSAKTDSAKAARSAFYCDLCQKGYSRMNEFEAHESSYDHQHKKRLKEMKEMQRQVQSSGRKEEKGPLMSIKLGGGGGGGAAAKTGGGAGAGGGGFKKGGFKNAFGSAAGEEVDKSSKKEAEEVVAKVEDPQSEGVDSDMTDEEDTYDPRRPTGCMPGCGGVTAVRVP